MALQAVHYKKTPGRETYTGYGVNGAIATVQCSVLLQLVPIAEFGFLCQPHAASSS